MQTFTNMLSRWLAILLLVGCFSSTAMAQRTVTLQLNTASLPDTTSTESVIQIRGALVDADSQELPDGNMLAWDDSTTLTAMNDGGDFWSTSFQIPDTTEMRFKFFSVQAEESAASIGGWEDNISDGAENNAVIPAGIGDTTLALHFFNKAGDQPYLWRPYEEKEDTIAVWFRVYANTLSAFNNGFDRESDSLVVGVRGDDFSAAGPLSWDLTLELAPERDDNTMPGYNLFSGVAYYPDSLAGTEQPYKFVFEDYDADNDNTIIGWEGDPNRTFTIPSNDSTLYWKYFDRSAPVSGEQPVVSTLLFTVDTSPLETIGLYDRGRGDSLEVRGEFNGWNCDNPDICELLRVPGTDLFEGAFSVEAFPNSNFGYKFFINHNNENFVSEFGDDPPSGWEEPLSTTGANRSFTFEGANEQDLGIQFFNDILPGNIIPDGTSIDVTFQVRMDSALVNDAAPFDPAVDTVTVELQGDALWAFTQGVKRLNDEERSFTTDPSKIVLTDDDGDGLYTGVLTVDGPTYGSIQYKYTYGGNDSFTPEMGGTTSDIGRRRLRFIVRNEDGSWPAEWTFPEESYQPEGTLPFEMNPAAPTAIERIGDELPTKIALEANYPNPFNPVTNIEYSLTDTEQISIKVYDLTGRLVSTLLDSVMPAGSYRVTFDAQDLASGIYVYRLESTSATITRKMVLLK